MASATARSPEDRRPSTSIYSPAHAWALWWAQQGFRVFRVCGVREVDGVLVADCWTTTPRHWNVECWPRPIAKKQCPHGKPGKGPWVKSWKKEATTDRNAIDRWFSESPNANYAVVIEPGYVVLDFDTPDAKHEWRDGHQEVAELGALPPTRTFHTGGGGEHRLFRTDHTDGCKLPAFEGLHMKGIVDVKANGLGYIIGTGSRHHSGSYYTCPDPNVEIAQAPEWLYDSPLAPKSKPGRRTSDSACEPTSGLRRRSTSQARIEAGRKLRAAHVENPDAQLSDATLKLLGLGRANGTERYEDDDQSQVTFRIVMGAIRVHYPLEKLAGLLRRPDSLGGMGLRKRIEDEGNEFAHAWLDDMVEKVFFYLATNRAAVRRLKAEAKRTTFKRMTFIDRKGNKRGCNPDSIRKVLDAILAIADVRCSLDPMVGVTFQLPDKTGLTDHACRRAIQALEALGWVGDVVEVPSDNGMQNAYKYRLLTDPAARENPPGRAMPPVRQERVPRSRPVTSAIVTTGDSLPHPGLRAYVEGLLLSHGREESRSSLTHH